MNKLLKSWLGQVTTGHGVMVLAPTVLAAMSGTMTWTHAAPLLVAGTVGLVWPENTALRDVSQTAATDIAGMVSAWRNQIKGG